MFSKQCNFISANVGLYYPPERGTKLTIWIYDSTQITFWPIKKYQILEEEESTTIWRKTMLIKPFSRLPRLETTKLVTAAITTNYPITTVLPISSRCSITGEQRRFLRTGNLYTQDGRATGAWGEAVVPPRSLKVLAWLDLPGNVATYCFVVVNLRIGQWNHHMEWIYSCNMCSTIREGWRRATTMIIRWLNKSWQMYN